jgi:hypothetical protein
MINDVPFLHDSVIERKSIEVIKEYEQKYNQKISNPVPVENILDALYDFIVEPENLQKKHNADVLAELHVLGGRRDIYIDNGIYPDYHPEKIGRYHFTLGHELGHWILHCPEILIKEQIPDMFEPGKPTLICRSHSKDRREIQADIFSGMFLMPHYLLTEAWVEITGSDAPRNVYEELSLLREMQGLPKDDRSVSCEIAKEMAPLFDVSVQAMQIRLENAGFISTKEDWQPSLF